jgi:hypothetical protein
VAISASHSLPTSLRPAPDRPLSRPDNAADALEPAYPAPEERRSPSWPASRNRFCPRAASPRRLRRRVDAGTQTSGFSQLRSHPQKGQAPRNTPREGARVSR